MLSILGLGLVIALAITATVIHFDNYLEDDEEIQW
jgi:hypothetical protein